MASTTLPKNPTSNAVEPRNMPKFTRKSIYLAFPKIGISIHVVTIDPATRISSSFSLVFALLLAAIVVALFSKYWGVFPSGDH